MGSEVVLRDYPPPPNLVWISVVRHEVRREISVCSITHVIQSALISYYFGRCAKAEDEDLRCCQSRPNGDGFETTVIKRESAGSVCVSEVDDVCSLQSGVKCVEDWLVFGWFTDLQGEKTNRKDVFDVSMMTRSPDTHGGSLSKTAQRSEVDMELRKINKTRARWPLFHDSR